MRIRKLLKIRAFTLIETLLYFSLVGVVLWLILSFTFRVVDANRKSESLIDLNSNVLLVVDKISKSIRAAGSVDVGGSVFDDANGVISLNMPSSYGDDVIFSIDQGGIWIKEGLAGPVRLTNENVVCTALSFHRIVYPKSPDQIVVDGFCESVVILSNSEKAKFPFHVSVALRN